MHLVLSEVAQDFQDIHKGLTSLTQGQQKQQMKGWCIERNSNGDRNVDMQNWSKLRDFSRQWFRGNLRGLVFWVSMFFSVVARRNLGRQASMLGQLSSMSKANFLLKLLLQCSPMLAYLRSLRPAEVIHPLFMHCLVGHKCACYLQDWAPSMWADFPNAYFPWICSVLIICHYGFWSLLSNLVM